MKPWQQSENTRSNFKVSIVLQLTILFTRDTWCKCIHNGK